MSAPKFRIGQEAVCILDEWYDLNGDRTTGPKKNEIYTVTYVLKMPSRFPGYGISIEGFGDDIFYEKYFEPVIRIDDLKAILEQQPEEAHVS